MDSIRRSSDTQTGCLICGKPIVYEKNARLYTCTICKEQHTSNALCEGGHYICDRCHTMDGNSWLSYLKRTGEKDPIRIFLQAVEQPGVHMHGPEHHSIVPGVLLTAYHNNGGEVDLPQALEEANRRGGQVPGGFCGFWGACGGAVGAGVYASIVTEGSPLKAATWSFPQFLTARCLERIAQIGGVRCCKRTSRIAIETAAKMTKEHLGIDMPIKGTPCTFHEKNKECLKDRCPYFGHEG